MFFRHFFILGCLLVPFLAQAEGSLFDAYTEEAKTFCDNSAQPWNDPKTGGGKNASIPAYPNLEANEILTTLSNLTSREEVPALRERIQKELDEKRIANFTGFKTLEIARIQYRTAMDHTFACSVLKSRVNTLSTLQEVINKTMGTKSSEIQNKLKKEADKMNALIGSLKDCNTENGEQSVPMSTKLVNTATRQYCHYGKYLQFLEKSLDINSAGIKSLEETIGNTPEKQKSIQNMIEWERNLSSRQEAVKKEFSRAEQTLPRAIAAYREMERTYGAHILLVILYDDYVKLRENLSKYMNSMSQLLEKAYNAQNPNK